MITMKMTDDIRKKEIKSFGPFTTRQMVCVLIGCVIAIPVALIIPANITVKLIVGAILLIPPMLCGYIKFAGMNLENFIALMIYRTFLTPKKRKRDDKILIRKDIISYDKAVENRRTASLTPKQLREYQKRKEVRSVIYSQKKEYKIYK